MVCLLLLLLATTGAAAASISFSGSNDQVTQPFSWNAGLMTIDWTSAGGLFTVHLVDMNGETVEYIASQYDEGAGSFAVGIDDAGQYMLEVDAGEPWTITLSDSLYSTTATTFSGTNNMVTPAFYCTAGRLDAAWTINDGLFIVHLIDEDGETVDYIASQYDEGPGSSVSSVKRAGYYMLTVEAGSPWTVALSGAIRAPTPQPPAPVQTPVYVPPVVIPTPVPTPVYLPPVVIPTPVPTPVYVPPKPVYVAPVVIPTPVVTLAPVAGPVVQPVTTLAPASTWGKRYAVGNPGTYLGSRSIGGIVSTPGDAQQVAATGPTLKPGSVSYGVTPPAPGSFVRWYPAARWKAGMT